VRHNRSFESYSGLGLKTALFWISYEATSWDLLTSGTTAFPVPALAVGEGALGRGGVLVQRGAQVREGQLDKHLQSQL
jgi:hypothetical protein